MSTTTATTVKKTPNAAPKRHSIRINDEAYQQLCAMAATEKRTISAQCEFIIGETADDYKIDNHTSSDI